MSNIEGDLKGGTASKHLNAISERILEQDPHPAGDTAAVDRRTRPGNAKVLSEAGFGVTTATVDVSSGASVHALVENATSLGEVHGVIHAASVSPSQASPETILKSRSLRNRAPAGGIWQGDRGRRRGPRDRVAVRAPTAFAFGRAGHSPGNHAGRGVDQAADASTG